MHAASFAPHHRPGAVRRSHSLPRSLTGFIGRHREVAEVRRLLRATRLLTLTGTGGIGKTRLGHEVATIVADECGSDVRLVELAALADPALVLQAVAVAVGVREDTERPLLTAIADALHT
jgi:predicted ATPase